MVEEHSQPIENSSKYPQGTQTNLDLLRKRKPAK